MKTLRLSFVGGGNMARSMIAGLISDGMASQCITVSEPKPALRNELISDFGIRTFIDNHSAIEDSDVVIFAIKPQIMEDVISQLADCLMQKDYLLLSIAAGISIKNIESWVGKKLSIVRAMPNSASLIRGGITALFSNPDVSPEKCEQAESIMLSIGKTIWLNDESLMDAVTAISGSGPAYFFYLMEALEQAALMAGLDQKTSRLLTIETALGAARLATETNESPSALRKRVTSPGGTTAAATEVLDENGTLNTIKRAVFSAKNRSQELSNTSGN